MATARRNPVELRSLLLRAAEDVFAREGYAAATTRDLAREAGVAESVLFRHFPSKAALFRESVLDPLMNVLSLFGDAAARYLEQPLDDMALMRLVMSELLDQLSQHRATLRSFVAAEDDLTEAARTDFHNAINGVLINFGAVARAEGDRRGRGNTGLGVETTARLAVAMMISLVVHDEWILGVGADRPGRAELVDHIASLILQGVG
jgi:AcrR family transcriptional regulator